MEKSRETIIQPDVEKIAPGITSFKLGGLLGVKRYKRENTMVIEEKVIIYRVIFHTPMKRWEIPRN